MKIHLKNIGGSAGLLAVCLIGMNLISVTFANPVPSSPEGHPTPTPSPTPTNTPTPTATPTSTPTSTPTPTPTPTMTPTPTPLPCIYSLASPIGLLRGGDAYWRFMNLPRNYQIPFFQGSGANLSCLQQMINNAVSACRASSWNSGGYCRTGSNGRTNMEGSVIDDVFLAGHFFDRNYAVSNYSQRVENYCRAYYRRNYRNCIIVHLPYMNAVGADYSLKANFMDGNCNLVTNPGGREVCGNLIINMWVSPISLLWDSKASIKKQLSVVNFPLAPDSPGAWFTWRASAETPLLVYAPRGETEITSAEQLFGNWTFGGKSGDKAAEKVPWGNGYEALATLDLNGDGVLDGEELDPISVWFDRNRDAVSQPGEVVSAKSAGLKSVKVRGFKSVPDSKDLTVKDGFFRRDKDQVIVGDSVDWYAEKFNTLVEGLTAHNLNATSDAKKEDIANPSLPNVGTGDTAQIVPLDVRRADRFALTDNTSPEEDADLESRISGVWYWATKTERSDGNDSHGALSLVYKDGMISGHSVVEFPVEARGGAAPPKGSIQYKVPVIGRAERVAGKVEIEFVVLNEQIRTTSIAYLSEDGVHLSGESETSLGSEGTDSKIAYSWIAKRAQ